MAVRIAPYTAHWAPAVRAFNARLMERAAAPGFLLDEAPPPPPGTNGALTKSRYLAVDEADDVRGGFMLQRQPFWIDGAVHRVANYQAPISEALVDRRYAWLGMRMLKEALQGDPLMFCLGMGGLDRPLPRLLSAMGWTLSTVPFLFRIARARRVFRALPAFRTGRRRLVADALALTGLASVGVGAHRALARWRTRRSRLRVERVLTWDAWADDVWEASRPHYAMAAVRNTAGLTALYPLDDPRNIAVRLWDGDAVAGWAVLYETHRAGHPNFGDLRVGTVLDCAARPGSEAAVAATAARVLDARGAELVITNQAHATWNAAFRGSGFVAGPSNYVLALSPALADAVAGAPGGHARIHATRGDADGRVHL
jgi:hypothetical protein